MKILILCTANCARSQLGEGIARSIVPAGFDVRSAGSHPSGFIHSGALRALEERGIDASEQYSKSINDLDREFLNELDHVITLCEDDYCPQYQGKMKKHHWPLPDPTRAFDEEQVHEMFQKCGVEFETKFREFLEQNGISVVSP